MVAHREFAAHPLNDPVQIAASRDMGQEAFVFPAHRVPVGTVHVRSVEVVAVDAPGLMEYLVPLCAGIDANLDALEVQFGMAG